MSVTDVDRDLTCSECGDRFAARVRIRFDHGIPESGSVVSARCPNGCAMTPAYVRIALGICPECGLLLHEGDRCPRGHLDFN